MVEKLFADHFTSIGGNTNGDGSPDGFGVFRHVRKFSGVDFVSV